LEVWHGLIFVWHEVIVKIKWKVGFGDLVSHDHGVWDITDNGCGNALEKLGVLLLMMTSVPAMLLTVLAALDYEYDFTVLVTHCKWIVV
jgi:hypothetical protein